MSTLTYGEGGIRWVYIIPLWDYRGSVVSHFPNAGVILYNPKVGDDQINLYL